MPDSRPAQAAADALNEDDSLRFVNGAEAFRREVRADPSRRPLWRELVAEAARRREAGDATAPVWEAWADAAMDARPAPDVA